MFGFKKLVSAIESSVARVLTEFETRVTLDVKGLKEHLPVLKRQDDKLGQIVTRLADLEKRMNGFAFTAVEASNLVGELRAMRHLLDERGQYKQLDKPMTEKELI